MTDPRTPSQPDVTQADRDMARDIINALHLGLPGVAEMLARHRLASLTPTQEGDVERVARALYETRHPDFADTDYSELFDRTKEQYRTEARAAIAAMPVASLANQPSDDVEREDDNPCSGGLHCCCCGSGEPCCDCGEIMPSKACIGEKCWCGAPASKKVGEEILFDDPMPARHNLTSYICARHYAQLMGLKGAEQVGIASLASDTERAAIIRELYEVAERILERGYISEHIAEERDDYLALKAALAKARGVAVADGRAAILEEAAKVAEATTNEPYSETDYYSGGYNEASKHIARAIRTLTKARGEA